MNQLNNLIKKELSFYFKNPLGYIVVCLFAIIANFLFMKDVFFSFHMTGHHPRCAW